MRATGTNGKPVCGQPVTVRLQPGSGGQLAGNVHRSLTIDPQSRRGLTDEQGRLEVLLACSKKAGAGADVLEARADFPPITATPLAIATRAGKPHHYVVQPARATSIEQRQFPLDIQVALTDEFDNRLAIAGRRVMPHVPGGATVEPQTGITDASGTLRAKLRTDLGRRWVYWIEAADDGGCSGRSSQLTVIPDDTLANAVRLLPNGYFAYADGRPFVPLGGFYANWVQSESPDGEWPQLRSFTDTTDDNKRRWMQFLHDSGVTAMRMMLRTHRDDGMEPMDVGGRVN